MPHPKDSLKHKVHEIIFEAETPKGKLFDEFLLVFILLSVISVMLETVPGIGDKYSRTLRLVDWGFTVLFTVEYVLRIYSTKKPIHYVKSFYGIIDFLAIVPTYLSLFIVGSQFLSVLRAFRLLRVFKILEMSRFTYQSKVILLAMRSSLVKISVFLFFVLIMVSIFGTVIFLVESPVNAQFDSIPRSVYYSIVTLTTVGFGDIAPITPLGQFLSSLLMVTGYGVIAVPTGIVTSEMLKKGSDEKSNTRSCESCSREGHDIYAVYCKYCGDKLESF